MYLLLATGIRISSLWAQLNPLIYLPEGMPSILVSILSIWLFVCIELRFPIVPMCSNSNTTWVTYPIWGGGRGRLSRYIEMFQSFCQNYTRIFDRNFHKYHSILVNAFRNTMFVILLLSQLFYPLHPYLKLSSLDSNRGLILRVFLGI